MAIHYAPKPREKGERGRRGGSAEAAAGEEVVEAEDDAVVFITDVGNAALHGFRSCMTATLHRVTIQSSTPPTVSLPISPLPPPDITLLAMALHPGSTKARAISSPWEHMHPRAHL